MVVARLEGGERVRALDKLSLPEVTYPHRSRLCRLSSQDLKSVLKHRSPLVLAGHGFGGRSSPRALRLSACTGKMPWDIATVAKPCLITRAGHAVGLGIVPAALVLSLIFAFVLALAHCVEN